MPEASAILIMPTEPNRLRMATMFEDPAVFDIKYPTCFTCDLHVARQVYKHSQTASLELPCRTRVA